MQLSDRSLSMMRRRRSSRVAPTFLLRHLLLLFLLLLLGPSFSRRSITNNNNVYAVAAESEDADGGANHTTSNNNKYYEEYREEMILDQQLKEAYESARKTLDTYNDVKSKLLLLSNDIISDNENNIADIPTKIQALQSVKDEVATKTNKVDKRIREINAMQIRNLKNKIEVLHQRELRRRSLLVAKEEFMKKRVEKALLKRKKKKAAAARKKKKKLLKLKKKQKEKKKKLLEKQRKLKQQKTSATPTAIPEGAILKDDLQQLVNVKKLMEESDKKIEELFIEIVEQEVDTLQGELEETVIEATTALQDLEESQKEKGRQRMINADADAASAASSEEDDSSSSSSSCSGATLTDAVQMVQQSLIKFSNDKVGMIDHLQKAHIVHHLTTPNFIPPSSQNEQRSIEESWWFQYIPEDWEIGFDSILPQGWREWNTKGIIPDYVYHTLGMYEQAATAPPEAILKPSLHPGSCWPMAGQSGHVTLRLPYPVKVKAVTMDHAPSLLFEDPTKRSSAPKKVRVFGFPPCWTKKEDSSSSSKDKNKKKNSDYLDDYRADSDDDDDAEYYRGICDDGLDFDVNKPVVLHDFEYDLEGPTIQTFHIPLPENNDSDHHGVNEKQDDDDGSCSQVTGTCGGGMDDFLFSAPDRSDTIREGMSAIRLEVTDNWGNKDYTCIYRFRIHGDAIDINED